MRKFAVAALWVAALAGAPAAAQTTTPLTYNVERTIGSGSVQGSITTDGTLGVLSRENIVDWTFALAFGSGSGPVTIRKANAGIALVGGTALVADLHSIVFDFSATNPASFFGFYNSEGSTSDVGWDSQEGRESVFRGDFGAFDTALRQGTVVIASRSPNSHAVPEPTSLALIGVAFLGLVASRWRARSQLRA